MRTKVFNTTTVPSNQTVVNAQLRPEDEMHILVGGPYTDASGEQHRYGHTALRVKSSKSDKTYDFGRYGGVTGVFSESGEGILRVWSDFRTYINGEMALKRNTTGFVYAIFEHQAAATTAYFDALIKAATPVLEKSTSIKKVYRLAVAYHALGPNCTTLSLDGAKAAIPSIDSGSAAFNKPEQVLNRDERAALWFKGGASRLFLPANLQSFLNSSQATRPVRIDTYP